MERVSMELAVSIDELERVGLMVADFCNRNGIDDKLNYALQLVCDEWVTNIVMHGYGGAPPLGAKNETPIRVSLSLEREGVLTLEFMDGAPPFNPMERNKPDLSLSVEERPIGGLGIHFITSKMDHCAYERIGDRNRLTLRKRIGTTGEELDDEHTD